MIRNIGIAETIFFSYLWKKKKFDVSAKLIIGHIEFAKFLVMVCILQMMVYRETEILSSH